MLLRMLAFEDERLTTMIPIDDNAIINKKDELEHLFMLYLKLRVVYILRW